MNDKTLEEVYEALAEAIDAVGPDREALFLAKLTLLLAHELDRPQAALALIEAAAADLSGRPA